ncbi:MAG: hypothetical protein HFI36_06150 [Bacilli bacterium]|jgi:hypothetical protein|nr:hypothetical protein [Bacilli bacterium]
MTKKVSENKKKKEIENKIDINSIKEELNKHLKEQKEEITKELNSKIENQIEFNITKRLKDEEKRIMRGKTGKIIRRDIIIIILLAIVGYFGYCLYDVDYFNIRTKIVETPKEPSNDKQNDEDNNNEPVVDIKPDSSYYIENFGYLVNRLNIVDESIFSLYQENVALEDLNNELILKIAYKNLPKNTININNNMITFSSENIQETAKNIFGEEIIIQDEMFSYNNIKFMYYNETYIGLKEEETKVGFLSKIIDAQEKNNALTFEIIVAKLSPENKLLNNLDQVIIEDYQNEDLASIKEKLNIYSITFENINDNYIFKNIELK